MVSNNYLRDSRAQTLYRGLGVSNQEQPRGIFMAAEAQARHDHAASEAGLLQPRTRLQLWATGRAPWGVAAPPRTLPWARDFSPAVSSFS